MTTELSRRRFLQLLATGGAVTFAGLKPWDIARVDADPLPSGAPVLVSIYLGGGLDFAHLCAPRGAKYGPYASKRPNLAIDEAALLPLDADTGLNPNCPQLHQLFGDGKLAVVRAVDVLNPTGFDPLSHFDKSDRMMAGRPKTAGPPSGVWGRWADSLGEEPLALAGVNFGVPLLLQGASPHAVAVPTSMDGALGSSDEEWQRPLVDAIGRLGNRYGAADQSLLSRAARTNAFAVKMASDMHAAYPTPTDGDSELMGTLRFIATLVNANITGTRVWATVHGGYDTHEDQGGTLDGNLLPDLDRAIGVFFDTLASNQKVILMVWSEFGRRAESNGSGTDHGRAGGVLLAGSPVKGGMYGAQTSFADADLDVDGNLKGNVDIGSVYTDILGPFLGGNPAAVLGASYPSLGVMR